MTSPVHLVTELKKYVDKPVKHWHRTFDCLPQEGKLLLIETISDGLVVAEYKLKNYAYRKECVFEDMSGIDWELCEVVKWMYIPEDECEH